MNKNKIVLGMWPLSGDFGPISLKALEETVRFALDNGVRNFDTAPNYGNGFSESALGMVLDGEENVNISTKCGNVPFVGKSFKPEDLEASLEQSLKRLRRDEITTLFLHNPRTEVSDYQPLREMFERLKAAGKIKMGGLSTAKGYGYDDLGFDALQFDANVLYLGDLKKYESQNVVSFARSPLATGMLSGRLTRETVFPASDYRSSWLKGERLESVCKVTDLLKQEFPDISLPSLARRFLMGNDALNHIIFGVKNVQSLQDIVDDFDKGPLSDEVMDRLKELESKNFNLDEGEVSF